jgi:hypothetical protein
LFIVDNKQKLFQLPFEFGALDKVMMGRHPVSGFRISLIQLGIILGVHCAEHALGILKKTVIY